MNTAALFQQLCHTILAGTFVFPACLKAAFLLLLLLQPTNHAVRRSHFSPEQGDIVGQAGSGMGAVVGTRASLPQCKHLFFKAHVRGRG